MYLIEKIRGHMDSDSFFVTDAAESSTSGSRSKSMNDHQHGKQYGNANEYNLPDFHNLDVEKDPHGIYIGHKHYSHRSPFLRAALLGANDGLVSVSAILLGVIAATQSDRVLILASVSAIVGGSLSMALGEYVSVSTQRDSEKADIQKEKDEHAKGPVSRAMELQELALIYEKKGLNSQLAKQVAEELSKGDVIRVHMRDELGIDIDNLSSPTKAAFFSGISFLVGSSIPLLCLLFKKTWIRIAVLASIDILLFLLFGFLSAYLGGASIIKACSRIAIGGIIALAATYAAGYLLGVQI